MNRVNVYLPSDLIARADQRARELGMNRSSLFGAAISAFLGAAPTTACAIEAQLAAAGFDEIEVEDFGGEQWSVSVREPESGRRHAVRFRGGDHTDAIARLSAWRQITPFPAAIP